MQTNTSKEDQNETLYPFIQNYLQYSKWITSCTHNEVEELNKYIQEKTKDLVQKFQLIAEKTIQQDQSSKNEIEKSAQTLTVAGKSFTYDQATIELQRLTNALIADSVMTYERSLLRKKIEEMLRALFNHAQGSKSFTKDTKSSVDQIKQAVIDIIIAFQFQDFVNQRMEHLLISLKELDTQTQILIEQLATEGVPAGSIPEDNAKALLDQFFLSKVQESFLESLNQKNGSNVQISIENEEDDIELF